MKEQPEKFYLLLENPELTNVCFWFVPERLRSKNFPQAYTSDWQRELGKVTLFIKNDRQIGIFTVAIINKKSSLIGSLGPSAKTRVPKMQKS